MRISHADARKNRVRALVVDDEPVSRLIATERLLELGLEVVEAADGFEAFARLRQDPFDIVVMDLDMPGLNGFDLLGCVRGHPKLSSLPIVILSGATDRHTRERALSGGATRYLTKPLEAKSFAKAIGGIVGFGLARLEPT